MLLSFFFYTRRLSMEQSKSMSENLYSLLPKMAVDYATFIGVGLFTKSYSAIWVNDPTTKSGVILAGLLNATAIGFATNYLANEETPVHYKALLSVVALSITIFATPYLTILLKDKFMIIITREAAFQIGSLH